MDNIQRQNLSLVGFTDRQIQQISLVIDGLNLDANLVVDGVIVNIYEGQASIAGFMTAINQLIRENELDDDKENINPNGIANGRKRRRSNKRRRSLKRRKSLKRR